MISVVTQVKICAKCRGAKSLDAFHQDMTRLDGKQPIARRVVVQGQGHLKHSGSTGNCITLRTGGLCLHKSKHGLSGNQTKSKNVVGSIIKPMLQK